MKTIYVTVQGGLVQDVVHVPAGIEVVVIDYDVNCEEADLLDVCPLSGEPCCLDTYTAEQKGVREDAA
jgi:hypothetical protein